MQISRQDAFLPHSVDDCPTKRVGEPHVLHMQHPCCHERAGTSMEAEIGAAEAHRKKRPAYRVSAGESAIVGSADTSHVSPGGGRASGNVLHVHESGQAKKKKTPRRGAECLPGAVQPSPSGAHKRRRP